MDITGKKLFVKALLEEGVDTVFAYPGGTVTDLFDELYLNGKIDLVLPRHEQALVHEAEGYARETGKTGVCLVTSGPVRQILSQPLQMLFTIVSRWLCLPGRYR